MTYHLLDTLLSILLHFSSYFYLWIYSVCIAKPLWKQNYSFEVLSPCLPLQSALRVMLCHSNTYARLNKVYRCQHFRLIQIKIFASLIYFSENPSILFIKVSFYHTQAWIKWTVCITWKNIPKLATSCNLSHSSKSFKVRAILAWTLSRFSARAQVPWPVGTSWKASGSSG